MEPARSVDAVDRLAGEPVSGTGGQMPGSMRCTRRLLRVGHKGAGSLAAGNTTASFQAALAAGVDMIEFDVLSERLDGGGRLLIAHDYDDLRERTPLTLAEALEHLSGEAYREIRFDVDLKLPGYGARVAEALGESGLIERSLVSCTYIEELAAVRRAAAQLRCGWSVPRVRRDYTADRRMAPVAIAAAAAMRRALPRRARAALTAGRADAIMAHWRLASGALVRAVAETGAELYVWTVDDAALMRRIASLGVDGIITNDPRLFETLPAGV